MWAERLERGDVHRQAQLRVRGVALAELLAVWRTTIDPDRFVDSWQSTQPLVEASVHTNRAIAAGIAAAYYRDVRRLAGHRGRVDITQAREVARERLGVSLGVTGPVTYVRAVRRGLTASQATERALSSVAGAVGRHVLDGGRDTIVQTVHTDTSARGWERITDGDPCAFCAMLAGRGAVYTSKSTAGFQPHDRCGCSPEPTFDGDPAVSPRNVRFRDLWQQAADGPGPTTLSDFRRIYDGNRAAPEAA